MSESDLALYRKTKKILKSSVRSCCFTNSRLSTLTRSSMVVININIITFFLFFSTLVEIVANVLLNELSARFPSSATKQSARGTDGVVMSLDER